MSVVPEQSGSSGFEAAPAKLEVEADFVVDLGSDPETGLAPAPALVLASFVPEASVWPSAVVVEDLANAQPAWLEALAVVLQTAQDYSYPTVVPAALAVLAVPAVLAVFAVLAELAALVALLIVEAGLVVVRIGLIA